MYFNVRVNVLRASYAIHRLEIYSQLYPDEGVGVGGGGGGMAHQGFRAEMDRATHTLSPHNRVRASPVPS